MPEPREHPYDVLLVHTGDAAEADSLDAAIVAARTLQYDARQEGVSNLLAHIYRNGEHVATYSRDGARP